MARGRRAVATVSLAASPSSILAFEDFADSLDFLAPGERLRVKLAGGEILDNILKHATPLEGGAVLARARRSAGAPLLAFFFNSPGFAQFAEEGPLANASPPLFDPAHRRWRGIGLAMCRNLARRVRFRPGERRDRIFLEFDPAPAQADSPKAAE